MKFTTMETMLAEDVAAPRFRTVLFAVFGALAVCLAMAGVYGVVACAAIQRRNEIGLRMALGAGRGGVVGLFVRQGMVLACIGMGRGLAASGAGPRLLKSMLFQVQTTEPSVYSAVALMVGVVTLVAGFVPASRVAKIDPATALRQE